MANILIIEDELRIRTLIGRVLKKAGHEVTEAIDGEEGLRMYQEKPTDLIITVLFMPRKSGLEVIAEVRQLDPEMKIITITAGLGDDCARAKELGAVRTLVKPIKLDELLETIEEVL